MCEKKVCIKLCDMQLTKENKKFKKQAKPKSKPKKNLEEVVKKKTIEKTKFKHIIKSKPLENIQKKNILKPKKLKTEIIKKQVVEKKSIPAPTKNEDKAPVISKKEVKTIEIEKEKELVLSKEKLTKEYIQDNISLIIKLLQDNLYYPRRARKKGITGRVIVKFTIGIDSKINDIKVLKADKKILSRAAIKTIQNLSGEFPKPKDKLTISVPIIYLLK